MGIADLVLVIEDDPDIGELLAYNLGREGFVVRVAESGEQGLRVALCQSPSLVLLDLMLPDMAGLEVCRRLKRHAEVREIPVIMLTAKSEEADVVAGLELGADDYITKPFSVRELIARVRAVLRRSDEAYTDPEEIVVCGPLRLDSSRYEATLEGVPLRLTLAEYRLLRALASHAGRVFTREFLVAQTTGGHHVMERNIDVHVASIRRKLGDAAKMIETVRGVGYKLRA